MGIFVHITGEDRIPAIRRSGVKAERVHFEDVSKGIFCMPVIADFYATHQWARELMRFGVKNPHGVYFRLPDDEPVWYGRYNDRHRRGTASQLAEAFAKEENGMGFQVLLPRKVLPAEINKIRRVPALGWRFYPTAKGRKPCLCPACLSRGEFGSHKMLEGKLREQYGRYRRAGTISERLWAVGEMNCLIGDHHLAMPWWRELLGDAANGPDDLLMAVGEVVLSLDNRTALEELLRQVEKAPPRVQGWFAASVLYRRHLDGLSLLVGMREVPEVAKEMEEYRQWMEEE